jgi:uncharacterized protein
MSSIDLQFVEYIVKSLVSKPDAVVIERRVDEKGVLLELTVDPEDLGRVIGKRGATAQSIRTLLRALGTKNEARYNLKIVDNGIPREEREANQAEQSAEDNHNAEKSAVSDDYAQTSENTVSDSGAKTFDTSAWGSRPQAAEDNFSSVSSYSDHNSVVSKTRKELEELDDLDV